MGNIGIRRLLEAILPFLLGLLSFSEALRLHPYGNGLFTGDHLFPGIIGILLMICSLTFLKREKNAAESRFPTGKTGKRMVFVLFLLLLFCLASQWIGFILCTFFTSLSLFMIIGNYRFLISLCMAFILTIILYVLFVVLLKMPMPAGFLFI